MATSWLRWAARGAFLTGAVLGGIALAGCEDNTTVGTLPPGQGTLDSPYIVQVDTNYKNIPMKKGGTLFFVGQDIPANWYEIKTSSSADINLAVNGYRDFFGSDGVGGSFTDGSGNESFGLLGDGSAEVYFVIDGTKVLTSGETFNLSIAASSAPAPLAVSGLGSCTFAPPSISCESPGSFFNYDTNLPFAPAPQAPLSISIDQAIGFSVFFRAFQCSQCKSTPIPASEPPIPFTENVPGYGAGYCHANLFGAGLTGTCQVSPVSGYDAPYWIRVVNNSAGSPVDVTVSFSTP